MNIKDELGNKIFMPIINSGSRIGAYDISREIVFGSRDDLALPKGVNKITLFFLPEKTMQKYDWKQIYDGQLYEIKVILTGSELKSKCWRYTYIPPDTLNINN